VVTRRLLPVPKLWFVFSVKMNFSESSSFFSVVDWRGILNSPVRMESEIMVFEKGKDGVSLFGGAMF